MRDTFIEDSVLAKNVMIINNLMEDVFKFAIKVVIKLNALRYIGSKMVLFLKYKLNNFLLFDINTPLSVNHIDGNCAYCEIYSSINLNNFTRS